MRSRYLGCAMYAFRATFAVEREHCLDERGGIEPNRVRCRKARLLACLLDRGAGFAIAQVHGVERHADRTSWTQRLGDRFVECDDVGQRGNLEPRVVTKCLARRLMTCDQAVGHAAVQQSKGHTRVSRVKYRSLSLDEDDVGVACSLEGDLLRGARDEVSDHGIDTNPPPLD